MNTQTEAAMRAIRDICVDHQRKAAKWADDAQWFMHLEDLAEKVAPELDAKRLAAAIDRQEKARVAHWQVEILLTEFVGDKP